MAELDRFRSRLSGLDSSQRAAVEALTKGIVAELLRGPALALAGTDSVRNASLCDALDLFGIGHWEGPGSTDREAQTITSGGEAEAPIHMPSPSYWPLFTSLGLPIMAYGMIYKTWVVVIMGGLWTMSGVYAWALEPATTTKEVPDHEPATRDGGTPALTSELSS